jgi:hypothetical protein
MQHPGETGKCLFLDGINPDGWKIDGKALGESMLCCRSGPFRILTAHPHHSAMKIVLDDIDLGALERG